MAKADEGDWERFRRNGGKRDDAGGLSVARRSDAGDAEEKEMGSHFRRVLI